MNTEILDFDEQLDECRDKLLILKPLSGVPLRIAQHFIKHSAYWDHPSAGLVNAPKHANRVVAGSLGYEISFGANRFLVGLAIERCFNTVSRLLDLFEDGEEYEYPELVDRLKLDVRGAVSNNDGYEYKGYYPIEYNSMVFGTQSIDVRIFTRIILNTTKIEKMYLC